MPATPDSPGRRYQIVLWLVFFAGALFFWPPCLDRYLAPRFLWVSAVLAGGVFLFRKEWRDRADWRLHGFDLLLLGWYSMNLLSLGWTFSWSEGIFYTQKVLILFGVYWLVRQALQYDENLTRRTLAGITGALTLVVSVLLLIQVGLAVSKYGLDNQRLYDYASGVFGNKGLATDFLFFLLIFNVLFRSEFKWKHQFWISTGVLLALILILQTRTVYLAAAFGMALYFLFYAVLEPGFRPVLFKRLLPAGALALVILAALLAWKGRGSTLAERLNPVTYLESASANERRFVWQKTDQLNMEHYWWGVGNGSWKLWLPSKSIEGGFRLQEKNIVFTRAHNDYLEIRAEMGMVGAVLFVLLFVSVLLAAGVAARRSADARQKHDLLVLSTGLTGYCIIQYFDFPRERIELQAILGLLFAYLAWSSRAVWARLPGISIRRYAQVFLLLLFAGFIFNVLLGWQRVRGEIHTVAVLEAQVQGNFPAMLREATAARNTFFEYNDVTIPLQWYEGIALYQMNKIDEAVAAFGEAYRLNPWAFQVINNYASSLVRANRHRDAVPLFEKALAINPRYDEGKFNLAFAWYALGDHAKAKNWLNRVDTIPNPQSGDERQKNLLILKKKAEFSKVIDQAQ
ncbi:MAG: O-antigen ligase family protein [Thermoanaerobaculia bacterium]|nr:O-antigen ligase family protein [Thermoanaerobaculia bacterium]